MALTDLSNVTRTFIDLITQGFNVSPAWSSTLPEILPEPPSRITANGLGFYLFHVEKDASYENPNLRGTSNPGVRFTSMALKLHYQLSSNSIITEETKGAFDEQTMMGIAMKVLHDYPIINDETYVNGVQIMRAILRGKDNCFKIDFQPVPHTEAIQYWTAGTSPVKLSAYYEVTTVLLEPETLQLRSGRVLAYGVQTFVHGAPLISNSQNDIYYRIPGESADRKLTSQPAQAPTNNSDNSRVTLWGSGLHGDFVEVLLLGRWDSWNNQAAAADASWNVESKETVITFDVQETAILESGNIADVLPGLYGIQVKVTRNKRMPDGSMRQFPHTSNQCPITITPRIESITPPNGNIYFTITGYCWWHADLDAELVQVYIGSERLTEGDPAALTAGEYGIHSASELRFIPPASPDLTTGSIVPIRILVNGAESPPNWITIP